MKNTQNTASKSIKSTSNKDVSVKKTVKVKSEKVVTPMSKLGDAVIKNIRTERKSWSKDVSNKFTGSMNGIALECFRIEKAGKASTPIIAHAVLIVKLPAGDLTITGPIAALAWKSLNKVAKVRGKASVDESKVADALKALGL
jgi:predicted transglutaminase-like cysteine proteinase